MLKTGASPGIAHLFRISRPTSVVETPATAAPTTNEPSATTNIASPAGAPAGLRAKAAANLDAIRVMDSLADEGRPATDDERDVLSRWSAWGALPKVFDDTDPEWADVRSELRQLLSDAAWDAARRTTINAFYTPPDVVAAMWEAATLFGFAGGMVLEPGCGSGSFIGAAPEGCDITGIELDPTTAAIAKLLHPTVNVRCEGFERTAFPDDWFDLVIGNVPFGAIALHDPRHNAGKYSMHNHFLAKSLRLLAPGGLAALITSRFTLDSQTHSHRDEIADLADLIGAVRLPNGAMKATAGTDVVVDVLFFRRRAPGKLSLDNPAFQRTVPVETADGTVEVNEYFAERPHLILGELGARNGMYNATDLTVRPFDNNTASRLRMAARQLHDPTFVPPEMPPTTDVDKAEVAEPQTAKERRARKPRRHVMRPRATVRADQFDPEKHQEGSILRTADLGFCQLVEGILIPFTPTSKKDEPELVALLDLRDTVLDLLAAQAASLDDADFAAAQAELNERYDAYVAKWGPLNRFTLAHSGRRDDNGEEKMRRLRPRMGGFGDDPAFHTVLALEHFDPDEQTATKADIFVRRVVGPRTQRDSADTPEDAMAICLDELGTVDVTRIAELLRCDEREARHRLGGLVWDDPATNRMVTTAMYLSGNVREKLAAAQRAARDDDRWLPNVTALQEVMPADLGSTEIDARLGSPWVEATDIENFVKETLLRKDRTAYELKVDHSRINSTWEVGIERYLRNDLLMTSTWGTPRADAIQLLQSSLNQTPATVYDTIETVEGTKKVLNQDETFRAREKQQELETRFRDWVWEDAERSERIVEVYNRLFNSVVLPKYDGSHLTLPGLNLNFTPHPHQRDAVWRILQSPTTLLAHPVGAGKTAVATAAGVEMRRLGLVKKPGYVVPNHMLDQFATEMLQLYPQMKVLVPTKKDMTPGGRRQFVARCAMGDWDAVVLTHSAFERIPVSPSTAREFLQEQLDAFREAANAEGASRMTVKKLEASCARLENKMLTLLAAENKDDGVNFESSGIDYLFVDESQYAKNLPFATHIRSVGGDGAQRAADLEMKLQYLRRKVGDRVTTFMTATPIANTIAEMFVVQKYLQPDRLAEACIPNFDGWAATFGSTVTALELAPDGGSYRMHTRFAKFHNVPELVTMFREVADVLLPSDLKLPIPEVVGGKPTTVIVNTSDGLTDYVAELVERAKAVRDRRVDPTEDNMLKVCGDGRKAALDLRLVGVTPDPAGGKIARCATEVADIYRRTTNTVYNGADREPSPRTGAFQLVFCDLGTPRDTWNVYQQLRDDLATRGVPASMVRFVHEAADARAKAELFAACRAGRVAVLVGSTDKMGIGTNVQTRLAALHHLDCPWRPDQIEQREGRGLRQGNQNSSVTVNRYATEKSFDVFMWQTVERKANFIHQVMRGDITSREIDDISEQALSYAEIKALATGNPMIMEKAGVDNDVARLLRLKKAHNTDQGHISRRLINYREKADWALEVIDSCESAIEQRALPHPFEMVVADVRYDERPKAGVALIDHLEANVRFAATATPQQVGRFAGFTISASCERKYIDKEITLRLDGTPIVKRWEAREVRRLDPVGVTMQLENAVRNLDTTLEEAEATLATVAADIAAAEARQGIPFDQEQLLAGLLRRQADLAAALAKLEEKDNVAA